MSDCRVAHRPVLVREVLDRLGVRAGGVYIDATLGGGGHAAAMLERMGAEGIVLGIDRDEQALARAAARLTGWGARCVLAHGNFAGMGDLARERGIDEVDGILMDIGVSSDQLEEAARGFGFQVDGPLDMRMDRGGERTAADVVNTLPEERLRSVFRMYGEERHAGRIARAIVGRRARAPFATTRDLAEAVSEAAGGRRGRLHPATRVFQALRIEVNDELGALASGLDAALGLLRVGGRMAVISFHSLEDRIVKRFFAAHAGREVALPEGGGRWVGELPAVRILNRKPVTASEEEQRENPRSRSAKMRVAERRLEERT